MNSKRAITGISFFILFAMLAVTTWASLYENVFAGGAKILAEPWGVATLFDTYFGFLIFYLWVFYKEIKISRRIIWFIGVMLLGNIAMSIYLILQVRKLKANEAVDKILLRTE